MQRRRSTLFGVEVAYVANHSDSQDIMGERTRRLQQSLAQLSHELKEREAASQRRQEEREERRRAQIAEDARREQGNFQFRFYHRPRSIVTDDQREQKADRRAAREEN